MAERVQARDALRFGNEQDVATPAETYGPLVASSGLRPVADVEAWLADQRRSAGPKHGR